MRKLICLLVLALVGCATTNTSNYIRVTGYGSTLNEAKLDAFAKATEIHVGTIIVSERESTLQALTKEDILAYSAGFVDDYKIVSEQQQGRGVRVIVDVSVSSNKINQRVLAKSSNTQNFNNQKHSAQYETLLKERNTGDRILENILNDYPKRAFSLKQPNYSVTVDGQRNLIVSMPYQMAWDKNYIASFTTALGLLEDNPRGLLDKTPGDIIVRENSFVFKHYNFKDRIRVNNVITTVLQKPVRLQAVVKNTNNEVITSKCYLPQFLSGWGPSLYLVSNYTQLTVNADYVDRGRIDLVIDGQNNQYRSVRDIGSIQLQIVSDNDCKR